MKTLSLHTCRFGCVTVRVFHMYSARYNGKSSCHQTAAGRSASWQRRPSVVGLMQGNLRRANQARAQSTRVRRTKDRERMEELPTLEQFRTGDAYNCMTLCVCVRVCVAASKENMCGPCVCHGM